MTAKPRRSINNFGGIGGVAPDGDTEVERLSAASRARSQRARDAASRPEKPVFLPLYMQKLHIGSQSI